MSQAPLPYILPSLMTGENGGVSHMSSGPVGTTSECPCRISDFPALLAGRYVPTTLRALGEGTPAFRITGVPIQFAAGILQRSRPMAVNKSVLYLIISVLAVAVGVLSYNLYQARKQPEGVQINLGPDGLKTKSK